MLISSVFVAILISTLYSINAGVVTSNDKNATTAAENVDTIVDSTHFLASFQHKLNAIDGSLQNLKEQAHTWAIFRYHIDAWNDQMKALEQKLDLVKRTQDEHQMFGDRLTSLEFTLNHILSRVVLLSDKCDPNVGGSPTSSTTTTKTTVDAINRSAVTGADKLLRDLERALDADRRMKSEVSTRLSNILRHVQNIENDGCQPPNKMADTAKAARSNNGNSVNVNRTLKALEQKLTQLTHNFTPKELKQMYSLAKKNGKSLERILHYATSTDKHLGEWREVGRKNARYCQAISGELSTFTESSDLLLKRIELMVHNVDEKISRFECQRRGVVPPDYGSGESDSEQRADMGDADDAIENSLDERSAEAAGESGSAAEEDEDEDEDEVDGGTPTHDADDGDNPEPMDATATFNADDFVQPEKVGCHELAGHPDGVYKFATEALNEAGRDYNERYCAHGDDGDDGGSGGGGAWTVIQNRAPFAQQENFNRSWAEYRDGFGDLHRDFWFGNEFIHRMVYRDDYALRVELEDFEGEHAWAEYSVFRVDSERYNYNLLIDGYRGSVPDSLRYHNEMDFSTYDRRNDRSVDACCSCASSYASGWWFDNCSEVNLNSVYRDRPHGHDYVGIVWDQWHGDYSLKKVRMMIRPAKAAAAVAATHEDPHTYNVLHEDP